MGYYMTQRDSSFLIKKENAAKALAALKRLKGKDYSWVGSASTEAAKTLTEMLDAWRWELIKNDNGDFVSIQFQGEKLGDDEVMFKAIAPFVEAGSWIEMDGEEQAIWRWVFDGKTVVENHGEVVFK